MIYDYEQDELYRPELYCDYCERDGHTFNQCPQRDDESEEDWL